MPIIKVWCLPENVEEDALQRLFWDIVPAVVGVRELGLSDEKDMTILFPPDRMRWGLGVDIIIEISGLWEKIERTEEVKKRLAKGVGEVVKKHFPNSYVECLVQTFDPKSGFWASERP